MEEKERFEYIHNDEIGDGILDIKTNNEIYDIEQMSDLLNQQDKHIKELEEENKQLKLYSIILPKGMQVGNKIFWANEDGVYSGKLCGLTKDINPNGGFNIWLYCLYDNGLSYWHLIKDYNVELFPTKEEAEQKFAELKGAGKK